jgi:hypothetical protein
LAIEICTGDFCFGGGANDNIKDLADSVDRNIYRWNGNGRLGRVSRQGAEKKKWPPARLHPRVLDRYKASL